MFEKFWFSKCLCIKPLINLWNDQASVPDCKNVREDLVCGSDAEGRGPWIYVFHDYLPGEHLFGGFIR